MVPHIFIGCGVLLHINRPTPIHGNRDDFDWVQPCLWVCDVCIKVLIFSFQILFERDLVWKQWRLISSNSLPKPHPNRTSRTGATITESAAAVHPSLVPMMTFNVIHLSAMESTQPFPGAVITVKMTWIFTPGFRITITARLPFVLLKDVGYVRGDHYPLNQQISCSKIWN
jgi:hypothetical protein